MRVLILSSSTGAGHDTCANAIKEAFDNHGDNCKVCDVFSFFSDSVATIVSHSHTIMYRYFPLFFNIGYGYMQNHNVAYSKANKTLINRILSLAGKKLYKHITDEGYEVVICTHPFATITLSAALKGKDHNVKTAFVATDYTYAPTVSSEEIDVYFIADEDIVPEFEVCGISKDKVIASGIPVRKMFYNTTDKSEAKESLGVNKDCTHLLVMCGSMGCGPIKKTVADILKKLPQNTEITVVCGTNKKLENKLKNSLGNNESLHILGFVKNMSMVLDSADLYLTKPGGLSVTEAKLKKLPMVFIRAVAGCEEPNRKHFMKKGVAVCGKKPYELSHHCLEILGNSEKLETMRNGYINDKHIESSKCIREYFAG